MASYKRNVWYNLSCLLQTYCRWKLTVCYKLYKLTAEKLLVSWQFFETYGVINCGSGWRNDIVNQCLEFDSNLDVVIDACSVACSCGVSPSMSPLARTVCGTIAPLPELRSCVNPRGGGPKSYFQSPPPPPPPPPPTAPAVPNKPFSFCGRQGELRSCVRVEVAVLDSLSLISFMASVDV